MDKIKLLLLDMSSFNVDELYSYLKIEDKIKVDKLTNSKVKRERIVSTYLKDKYVGEYYLSKDGKPLANNIYFNVSHSDDTIVIAFSELHPVGVDIEKIKPIDDKLKKEVLSMEEYNSMKNDEDFYALWTSKEALLKCIGTGISTRLNDVPALPLNGEKHYKDRTFYCKNTKIDDYYLSIVVNDNKDFKVEYIK